MRLIDADALNAQISRCLSEIKADPELDPNRVKEISVLILDAVIETIQLAPTVDGWVSVEDKLPSEEGYYFVWAPGYFGKNWIIGDIAYSNFKPNYKEPWAIKRGCGYSGGWTVTHWMPLPEAPGSDG